MGEAQKRVGSNIRIVHLGWGWLGQKGSSLNYGHVVVAADRIKATPPCWFLFPFIFSSFRVGMMMGLHHKHVETWNKNKNQ